MDALIADWYRDDPGRVYLGVKRLCECLKEGVILEKENKCVIIRTGTFNIKFSIGDPFS